MIDVEIMRPSRWSFDARAFVRAREASKMSAGEFARRMDWSRSYQSKLEGGLVRELESRVAARVLQVLSSQGVMTNDDISIDAG